MGPLGVSPLGQSSQGARSDKLLLQIETHRGACAPGIRGGLGLRTGIRLWACFPPAPSEEVWGLIKGLVPSQRLFVRTWGGSLVYLGGLLTLFLVPRISRLGLRFSPLCIQVSQPLSSLPPTHSFPQFLLTDAQALLKSLGFPVPLALDRDFRPHNKSYYGSLNYRLLQDRRPRLFVGDTTECCYSLPYVPGPSSLVAVGSREEVESCPQPHPLAKVFRESFRCQMPETQDSRPGFPR